MGASHLPPSLGAEWLEECIKDLSEHWQDLSTEDQLRTSCEFIAATIAAHLPQTGSILVTGGGAFNDFLIELIREKSSATIEVPSKEIIEMKEAICFAFLGLLRLRGEESIIAQSTGAKENSIAGSVYLP